MFALKIQFLRLPADSADFDAGAVGVGGGLDGGIGGDHIGVVHQRVGTREVDFLGAGFVVGQETDVGFVRL